VILHAALALGLWRVCGDAVGALFLSAACCVLCLATFLLRKPPGNHSNEQSGGAEERMVSIREAAQGHPLAFQQAMTKAAEALNKAKHHGDELEEPDNEELDAANWIGEATE